MDNLEKLGESIISKFTPGDKVIIAMSGGVDSSVTAWAAKQAGCDVIGVTLLLYGDGTQFKDAENIAKYLNIDWYLADYREYFNEDIISNYINSYKKGETPNPCCLCNRIGKTKYLIDEMKKRGASKVATGHYVNSAIYEDRSVIIKSKNTQRDQSYYLCLMKPNHIKHMIYPLSGVMDKEELRALALKVGLSVAPKKDSYEACFLQGSDYREFLSDKLNNNIINGNFILDGKTIGSHKGLHNYTVGQRKGLDVSHAKPLYVQNIDNKTGNITLSERGDVYHRGVKLRDCVFYENEKKIFRGTAKLRYKMIDSSCYIELQPDNKAYILFDDPQFAPTPGQVAALYNGDRVVGGGYVEGIF